MRRGGGRRRRDQGGPRPRARSPACPSAGRTASTSPGCRPPPARRCSADRQAVRDAAVVARVRAAGGVSVGKLAMHELAWGMMGWAHRRPSCPNPYAPDAHRRRIVDGLGGRGRHGPGRPRAGHGHGRLGARAGEPVRRRGHEADLRHGAARRLHPVRQEPRPRRPDRPLGARLRRRRSRCWRRTGRRRRRPSPLDGVHIGVLERHFCEQLDPGVEAAFRAALDALARAGAVLRHGRPGLAGRRRRPAADLPVRAAAAGRRGGAGRSVGVRLRRRPGRHPGPGAARARLPAGARAARRAPPPCAARAGGGRPRGLPDGRRCPRRRCRAATRPAA